MWFWLVILGEAREVMGIVGERASEQKCYHPSQNWNPGKKKPASFNTNLWVMYQSDKQLNPMLHG